MMGKYGALRRAKPISVPDQRFYKYPLDGARRFFLAHVVPRGHKDMARHLFGVRRGLGYLKTL